MGLSAVVSLMSYRRNSEATLHAAERLLEQEGERIVATTEQLIEPLFSVTNSAVLLPGIDATAGAHGEHLLAPVMFSALERYPQMTALYIGNGNVVQALHTGTPVQVTDLYYAGNPIAASRP